MKSSVTDKQMAARLRAADARRAKRVACTIPMYSCKTGEKDALFGAPFLGINNEFALKAVKEICPTLNLYMVGYFHTDSGRLETLSKPKIVLENEI